MRHLVSILFLLPALCLAQVAAGVAEDDVTVDYRNGVYFGRLSLLAPVSPVLAVEVLTDFEHMVDFVPNLTSSRIVSRAGNVYRIAQQGKAKFGPFAISFESERRVELTADGRLLAQALSGSTKSMKSELRIEAVATGTRLDYKIEMEPEQWLPSALGVSFMRHELAEQFTALIHEMQRRNLKRLPR